MTLKQEVVNYMNLYNKMVITGSHTPIAYDLGKTFDVQCYTGQKRTVLHATDSTVLKLVSSREGLEDNINALISSEHLRDLEANGSISKDDLALFAIAEAVDDDPFIIEANAYTLLRDSNEYLDWYKNNKDRPEFRDSLTNEMIGYFVLETQKLNEQQQRILQIIAKYFIGSDLLAFKVPENYGIDRNGNLVLIDLGSILPKYRNVDVKCWCGSDKALLVLDIKHNRPSDIADAMALRTCIYGCTNKNCDDYGKDITEYTRATNNCTDSIVFDNYRRDVKGDKEFVTDCALLAKIFIPSVYVGDFFEYKKELDYETGYVFSESDAINLWINSLPYIISDTIEDAVYEVDRIASADVEYRDYREFCDLANDEISRYTRDSNSPMVRMYVAVMYIKYALIEERCKDINLFEIVEDTADKSRFFSDLNALSCIDSRDFDDIYNDIEDCYR